MLCGHGGDGDVKCRFTLARTVVVVGQGGRGDGGGVVGEVDWAVALRAWRAGTKELGGDGVVLFHFGACERARER